jgi:glycosyltransferase involved in cell wall biosynthesis
MKGIEKTIRFYVFAPSVIESDTMAGGYRIFIECLRQWLKKDVCIELYTSKQGQIMVSRYLDDPQLIFQIIGPNGPIHNPGFRSLWFSVFYYLLRSLNGIYQALFSYKIEDEAFIYSTTPFWPDIFPAAILRLRNPKTLWLVAFSMYAPPVRGGWSMGIYTQKKVFDWRALALKINEIIVYPIIRKLADIIYVNNELDLERIRSDGFSDNRTLVIGGGVNVEYNNCVPDDESIKITHGAVFVGRFHPQKGVIEVIDIWQEVCNVIPDAHLTMIGNGPLENDVQEKVKRLGLEENIHLIGFKDGMEKINIFQQNLIIIHPSLKDSGGMAAAEAMIYGLPGLVKIYLN